MHNPMLKNEHVDAETLNALLSTDWMVRMKPSGYYDRPMWMSGGCASKRDDPEDSHIGLRAVAGTASGEDRHCGNRPAANPSMGELANGGAQVYVPIQWALKALESDDLDDFTSR